MLPADPLAERRLLLFTGKGGVGKSSVVAALGVAAAERGLRPLIVELGHRASMANLLGGEIGHEPRAVACEGRLAAMSIDQDEALFDYIVAQVRMRRVARAIAGNQSLRGLFRAAPAVREVITLAKIQALVDARDAEGRPRWQPILVDLDATGHALMLLGLPQLLRRLVASGPLVGVGEALAGLIADPARTLLLLVTLAREIPAQETIELFRELRLRHRVDVGALVVNQVPAPPLDDALLPWLDRAEARVGRHGPLAADLALARRLVADHASALRVRERLAREVEGVPQLPLPHLAGGIEGEVELRVLAAAAEAWMSQRSGGRDREGER
ncbi:MAG: hypothetical protein H6711_20910 [Myxococcales bacterium]|nr:hypothetical protein [Myxococcales bacterium]